MPAALSPPGIGPSRIGRFYQPPRNTVLSSPSPIIPVGIDGHVDPVAQGTAVTSALPTGIIDGDLILIEVSHGSGGPPGTTITTPVGWNLLSNLDDGSVKLPTFWRFFVTGDAAPSFTLGTSRSWCTRSTAFRYVDPFHPFGPYDMGWQQTAQASASTYTSGTITPLDAGAMLVVCWGGKIAAGATQTITIPAGWNQTAPISQCTVPATVSTWAHFQYKPLGPPAATNEVVTIGNSAVGQATIIALRPLGSATPVAFGSRSISFHPGRGTSNAGRFYQAPQATDIAATGETHSGTTDGAAHSTTDSTGTKGGTGSTQAAGRPASAATWLGGHGGATQGACRPVTAATGLKGATGAAATVSRAVTQATASKQAAGAAQTHVRSQSLATGTQPQTHQSAVAGHTRAVIACTGTKGALGATQTASRSTGTLAARKGALGACVAATRVSAAAAALHGGRGATQAHVRSELRSSKAPPPPIVLGWEGAGGSRDTHDATAGQLTTGEATGTSSSIHEGDDTTSSSRDATGGTFTIWEGG